MSKIIFTVLIPVCGEHVLKVPTVPVRSEHDLTACGRQF